MTRENKSFFQVAFYCSLFGPGTAWLTGAVADIFGGYSSIFQAIMITSFVTGGICGVVGAVIHMIELRNDPDIRDGNR